MYTVINRALSRLAFTSALFITLISSVVRAHQECGQEDLVRCAQPLQVLTEGGGLSFVASKKDLDIICPDLQAGLRCVHRYTRRCMHLQQRAHFNKLFHGTSNMVTELCSNGTYQEEYLKYAPCMREVVDQNEICFKRYQVTMENITRKQSQEERVPNPESGESGEQEQSELKQEDEGIKNVCCSFQEYVECSTHTMRRTCGDEAARFSRGFLDRMSSSMIKLHCSEFVQEAGKCGFGSSATSKIASLLTILTSSLIVILLTVVR